MLDRRQSLTERWSARWNIVPDAPPSEYGVYHFRRTFDLASQATSFTVHVTGDMRYQFFVNGKRVLWGPARSDLFHWRYDTIDIAQYLNSGADTLAAVVWNEGQFATLANISNRTAFLVQGDGPAEQLVNTGKDWKCIANTGCRAYPITPENRVEYWAVGPGQLVDAALWPWGWEQPGFDDSKWTAPQVLGQASPRDGNDGPNAWMLTPRPIPPMQESPDRLTAIDGDPKKPVPANSRTRILFDAGALTTAFPELTISGGKGARVTMKYIEGPRSPKKYGEKPRRDQVAGSLLVGPEDILIADGGRGRTLRPLFWRCYRYLELTVETSGQPLTIDSLTATFTAYPFVRKSKFEGGAADLRKILDAGWRTARLCAHETYMDTPCYEQLQYVGDTRIQAMVSLYNSGDARLMRNAIEQIDASRTSEGATFSRAPSALAQYIPPFSLWWIGMVHDYWMYVDDAAFAASMLPGVRAVLGFFARYQRPDKHLKKMPWWNYIDWVQPRGVWPNNSGPAVPDRMSALQELQLLMGYQWASQLEAAIGDPVMAAKYADEGWNLGEAIRTDYCDAQRGLFADSPDKQNWSQHGNSLAVLAGLVPNAAEAKAVMEKVLADDTLVRASIYFQYYVRLAMRQAGLGGRYLSMLDKPWRWALQQGFSTWPETDSMSTRSDCHAWGASPNIELFRIVPGIDTAAPGFGRIRIEPNLGDLRKAAGSIPHPKGVISVRYTRNGDKLNASVESPVPGLFVWAGKEQQLNAGENQIAI
ncbi:MAG: alpha-L-rhamnosidase N-terminal domain-containing protein [Bryobacteraceae bacterium]|nr:alpha-L-rhamnosidase N-terminal domain-containing protein [Bryobacteraceae bacterium]